MHGLRRAVLRCAESGELILVVAGEGVAFVVFGACTPM